MALDQDACYEALRSKDARFDGQFFVGVSSTGIYCRVVCHARLPKRENCTFYETAAQAEAAGYRPCLQCRPELAPGMAPVDSEQTLARKAARLLKENCRDIDDLETFAGKLGYTGRHLRRAFNEEFGVSPQQYLQTCRLLLAKQLLGSTRLPIAQVAEAAGFGSQRRFNDAFKQHYSLVPSEMRRRGANAEDGGCVVLELGYRPPYQWQRILDFLEMRAIPGVETVRERTYYRTVRLSLKEGDEVFGWLSVQPVPGKNIVRISVSPSLLGSLPQVIARIRHQFDLDCDPCAIAEGMRSFNEICPGRFLPGTRVPGCFDVYEMCVRAVLGQQISVKGASTLAGRVATAVGTPLETGISGLTHMFPSPQQILDLGRHADELLGSLGIIGRRVDTILVLAGVLGRGEIDLAYGSDPAEVIPALEGLPVIGPWTAQYITMRTTGYPDAFPSTDLEVKKALAPRTQKEIDKLTRAWSPWRAYAAMSLWSSDH